MTAAARSDQFTCSLLAMPQGQSATVSHFKDQFIAGRLMSMGVLPGSQVRILRRAPFGGGLYIQADELFIALRNEEADMVCIR